MSLTGPVLAHSGGGQKPFVVANLTHQRGRKTTMIGSTEFQAVSWAAAGAAGPPVRGSRLASGAGRPVVTRGRSDPEEPSRSWRPKAGIVRQRRSRRANVRRGGGEAHRAQVDVDVAVRLCLGYAHALWLRLAHSFGALRECVCLVFEGVMRNWLIDRERCRGSTCNGLPASAGSPLAERTRWAGCRGGTGRAAGPIPELAGGAAREWF
jgi:hypothetical protein